MEKSTYDEFVKEKEGECPLGHLIEWNSKAKRCQKKIESGDTKFVRTKCCINQIQRLEKAVEKKIKEVKKSECAIPNCPFVFCMNGEIKQVDAKGCELCPKCKVAKEEAEEDEVILFFLIFFFVFFLSFFRLPTMPRRKRRKSLTSRWPESGGERTDPTSSLLLAEPTRST
jgi:hypothetical protein